MEINERARTHRHSHATNRRLLRVSCGQGSWRRERGVDSKWDSRGWSGRSPLDSARGQHTADTLGKCRRQQATSNERQARRIRNIRQREIESWTSNRHRLLPLGSSIFVCCQMLLNCHAPNCNDPLTVQCDSTQETSRETSVFQFTTRMNMNSEYSYQLNSSDSREFMLITASGTRVIPGTN